MASLNVHAPDGKTLTVQVPEGTDPGQYGALADDALSHYTASTKTPSFAEQIPGILKQAGQAVLDTSPAKLTQKFMQTDPATMTRMAGPGLPIVGGMAGMLSPIPGAAAGGAMIGEGIRQSMANAFAPETGAKTIPGQLGSIAATGLMQEPQILNKIPGISQVTEAIGNVASKAGSKAGSVLAKVGEVLTGAKAKDLEQAAKQGLSTYAAPSMEEAQKVFGEAARDAGVPARPPLKQVVDPQLSTARKVTLAIGDKLDKGMEITPAEALNARQAVDRIYNATSLLDRSTRAHLADLRTAFDDVIANKAGALKEASTLYRQAIVKSNILNPFRITKQGQYSAVAPMVASLIAGGIGSKSGHGGAGAGAGYLAASSPFLAGLAATTGGSGAQAINAIAQNPAARQALLQVLQRLTQKKQK